ncbi:MAG TPA: class I SAM-dependent methyltransferase [bacterium]|nr:class I SAM-dependent methyltransferase [bacterium]
MENKSNSIKHLYHKKYFMQSTGFQIEPTRIRKQTDIIKSYNPKTVLDVGCGLGSIVKLLRSEGIEAYGIDFADVLDEKFWKEKYFSVADANNLPFPNNKFDLVFSSDFFEHIPENEIDRVFSEMKRVGKTVVSYVAVEAKLNSHQRMYHVTNKPREWWEDKLKGIDRLLKRNEV